MGGFVGELWTFSFNRLHARTVGSASYVLMSNSLSDTHYGGLAERLTWAVVLRIPGKKQGSFVSRSSS